MATAAHHWFRASCYYLCARRSSICDKQDKNRITACKLFSLSLHPSLSLVVYKESLDPVCQVSIPQLVQPFPHTSEAWLHTFAVPPSNKKHSIGKIEKKKKIKRKRERRKDKNERLIYRYNEWKERESQQLTNNLCLRGATDSACTLRSSLAEASLANSSAMVDLERSKVTTKF